MGRKMANTRTRPSQHGRAPRRSLGFRKRRATTSRASSSVSRNTSPDRTYVSRAVQESLGGGSGSPICPPLVMFPRFPFSPGRQGILPRRVLVQHAADDGAARLPHPLLVPLVGLALLGGREPPRPSTSGDWRFQPRNGQEEESQIASAEGSDQVQQYKFREGTGTPEGTR